MKKGFTIVELMMVVGIIGILLGIVTTAAASSIKQARVRKAEACCTVVEQGLAAYSAQHGQWPGNFSTTLTDRDAYELSSSEVNNMIRTLVREGRQNNTPYMDVSGLYVSRQVGEKGSKAFGLDFRDAVRGTKRTAAMSVAQMNFGYPETDHGYFRHFKIVYSIPTDEMKVSQQ